MATRMFLTREYDDREDDYVKALPHVWVEKVMPAYASYRSADAMLGFRRNAGSEGAAVEVLGWELFVPEDSNLSDYQTLEAAAKIARSDDFRMERESFRDRRPAAAAPAAGSDRLPSATGSPIIRARSGAGKRAPRYFRASRYDSNCCVCPGR